MIIWVSEEEQLVVFYSVRMNIYSWHINGYAFSYLFCCMLRKLFFFLDVDVTCFGLLFLPSVYYLYFLKSYGAYEIYLCSLAILCYFWPHCHLLWHLLFIHPSMEHFEVFFISSYGTRCCWLWRWSSNVNIRWEDGYSYFATWYMICDLIDYDNSVTT